MKKIALLAASFLCANVSALQAQHTFTSLNDVWSYALSNNPESAIYQLKIKQAIQDKRNAISYLYPKVGLSFAGQRNIDIAQSPVPGELVGKPGETVYLKFGQNYAYNGGVTISKTILDWQSMYQYKIAKTNVALQCAEKDYYEQTLKEQVAQTYYATLTAMEAVTIGSRDLEIADSMLYLSTDRFNQGIIDALTLNQAKINRNNVLEQLEQSKQYQQEYINNLKILLGLSVEDTLQLQEKVETTVIGTNDNISTVASNTLYTEPYRLQAEIARYEQKKAIARFAPKIDVSHYFGGTQYQSSFDLSLKSADWKPSKYFGLSISVPLFTGFSNKSQYSAAKISRSIAEKGLQNEIRKSAINDSTLLNGYYASIYRAQAATESYKISGSNISLAAQKYAQGLISLDEYLKVFDDYLGVESQYLNRLSDYLINKATIEARKK